jgi:hypothetical protein
VFLRVLEYYNGILFLTTNRVGTLDEAFKSRIHVSLYYPPLDKQQTLDIFRVNIRKLKEIVNEKQKLQEQLGPKTSKLPKLTIDARSILHYAEWHFDHNEEAPEQRWNGRQIRNAFQIGYSLAQFDLNGTAPDRRLGGDERGTPVSLGRGDGWVLDYRQFKTVAAAVAEFENYLNQATNGTDADRAHKALISDDYFDSRGQRQRPAYNPPVYQRQLPSSQAPRSTYQPLPARRDEQSTSTRRQYRPTTQKAQDSRPQQRPANVRSSTPIRNDPVLRKRPNAVGTAGPRGGGRSGMPKAVPGQQEQQQFFRATNTRDFNAEPARLAGAKHSDSGYSGWSSATARSPGPGLDASSDWQLDEHNVAVDGEYDDDGLYEDRDEGYLGSGQYEGDSNQYGLDGEEQGGYDDLDGMDGEGGQYLDEEEDAERWHE